MKNLILLVALFSVIVSCAEKTDMSETDETVTNNPEDVAIKNEPEEELDSNYVVEYLKEGTYAWDAASRLGILRITNVKDHLCDFELTVSGTDACLGEISGSITLDQGGKASYEKEDCELVYFQFLKDGVSIKEHNCDAYHGAKCSFDGHYVKEVTLQGVPISETLNKLRKSEMKFDFYASFTEPFWMFYIIGDQLIWEDFDQGHNYYEINKRFDPFAEEQTITYSNGKIRGELLIQKKEGTDGMSEITYPYHVVWNDSFQGGGGTEFMKEEPIEE